MEWIIGLGIVCVAAYLLHRGLNNAPTCVCGRSDCGGGCIGRNR